MKAIVKIAFILLLQLIFGQLMSQNSETVVLSASMNDFSIHSTGENKHTISSNDLEYYYNNNQNLPAIPIRNISVLVPNGAEIIDYDFSIQKTLIESDLDIDRSPSVISILPSLQTNPGEFVFNGVYPEKPIQYLSRSVQRGFTQFNFCFSPFIYNGENKNLEFISYLELIVNYKINESKIASFHPYEDLVQAIQERVANPTSMERLYDINQSDNNKSAMLKLDYLIVTNNHLKVSFEPLIEWKNRKGLYAKIITIEDIYEKYDEPTNQLKIKRCLLDFYENTDLKWVLLGGDVNVVPVQYCYNNLMIDVDEDTNIPTDLFYACLDSRFDWNSYKDDKIGELFWDAHDVTPEVYLTRLPVNTREETEAIVKKTIDYETNPVWSNSLGKTIFAGVKLWNVWQGKSDSHHRSEFIYNKYLEGNILGDNFNFFDTGTDFYEGSDHDVTSFNFKKKLNNGFGLLHFIGHGGYQSLNMESGNVFGPDDVLNLTNQVGGIVLTNACYTNAFDIAEPSLSEAFIRNPVGGCVAYFGSSRYSFGNADPSRELGASLKYNAKFFDYIFSKKLSGSMTFGEITTFTKNHFSDYGLSNRHFPYLLYAINPVGDPELPLYKGTPRVFNNIRIYEIDNLLYVHTGGVENSRICITSLDMSDGFKRLADKVSFHTFENLPDQFQITITAPNYKPYIYYSGNTSDNSSNIRAFINVFPNPAGDYIQVDFNLSEGQLYIYDINGKLLKELAVETGTSTINISDLPEGVLMFNFIANEGIAWFKIVK